MDSLSMSDDGGSPVQRRNAVSSRRKKSAAQIEFLERLYAENKYPSEEVRASLSAQLGLSEKQMQIWFTHRRHKDRKDGVEDVKLTFYAMRHKGGEAHLDFMEELNSGKRTGGNFSNKPDMPLSGGRQLSSYPGGEGSPGQHMADRRTDSESENSGLGQADDINANGFKPSLKRGSLVKRKDGVYKRPMTMPPRAKVEAKDLELAVISAVETQLGESLRMDGPRLGMEFDALPPGAWTQLANAGVVPVAVQGRGPTEGQGRGPTTAHGRGPLMSQDALQGRPLSGQGRGPMPIQSREPMGVQGRLGRIQSVGTY